MLKPIIGVIGSGRPARFFRRYGFTLNLSLLILVLSPPTAYPRSDLFQISFSLQQSIAANRAASQSNMDTRVLEAGKPIERELAGGEAHTYQLTLAAGQYATVVVDQQRINVALSA